MTVYTGDQQAGVLPVLEGLMRHHDHVKQLKVIYQQMRHKETYQRMGDTLFHCNDEAMKQLNTASFTSLIIPINLYRNKQLYQILEKMCREFTLLLNKFYPTVLPQCNLDAAHITVRSIVDFVEQDQGQLRQYFLIVQPIVEWWLKQLGEKTRIFFMGLFSNLQPDKGLSIGIRIYPSLPLIQGIRGEAGLALYGHEPKLPLRPETQAHTSLIHSTLLRVRNLELPLPEEFIGLFKKWIEGYDTFVFGSLSGLTMADFCIRNGRSDKLLLKDENDGDVGCEISLRGGG